MSNSTDDFNPYHKWLGIPLKKQPPTIYQLLGISLDEEDAEVIRTAASRQRTHIEQFEHGPHHQDAVQLLYQIGEAEATLLSPDVRRDYDRRLDLFQKRQKRRQVDPIVQPSPDYSPTQSVGEESGLFREYLGIMSIILGAFIIMAVVSFWLPWRKVVFDNDDVVEQAVEEPMGITGPMAQSRIGIIVPEEADTIIRDNGGVEAAIIDATITVIDVLGRSVTVSRNTNISILDVSRKALIIIDGNEATLDLLVPNQTASITFDPEYDVITKIEVTGADSGSSSAQDAGPNIFHDESLATVDVTISDIDVAGREMTITRNSKTTVFDISRKAAVKVDGKAASLESLKPGQTASITFDPEFDIVVIVEAAATEIGASTPQTTTATDKPSTAEDDNLATIDATITAIDAADRSITVSRKSKSISFDISRKVEVSLEGKTATLDSLKPGQKASITFNTEFDVVMKIEVSGSDTSTDQKN